MNNSLSPVSFVALYATSNRQRFPAINHQQESKQLKSFNDYLQLKGIVKENSILVKRDRVSVATGSERVVEALTDAEVERVLAYVQDESKVSFRNRLIVHTLLYTAVRVSELVNIRLKDIDKLTSTLTVKGKGGKVREIGINDLMEMVKDYLAGERKESRFYDSKYLLVSQRSKKMHRDAVRD